MDKKSSNKRDSNASTAETVREKNQKGRPSDAFNEGKILKGGTDASLKGSASTQANKGKSQISTTSKPRQSSTKKANQDQKEDTLSKKLFADTTPVKISTAPAIEKNTHHEGTSERTEEITGAPSNHGFINSLPQETTTDSPLNSLSSFAMPKAHHDEETKTIIHTPPPNTTTENSPFRSLLSSLKNPFHNSQNSANKHTDEQKRTEKITHDFLSLTERNEELEKYLLKNEELEKRHETNLLTIFELESIKKKLTNNLNHSERTISYLTEKLKDTQKNLKEMGAFEFPPVDSNGIRTPDSDSLGEYNEDREKLILKEVKKLVLDNRNLDTEIEDEILQLFNDSIFVNAEDLNEAKAEPDEAKLEDKLRDIILKVYGSQTLTDESIKQKIDGFKSLMQGDQESLLEDSTSLFGDVSQIQQNPDMAEENEKEINELKSEIERLKEALRKQKEVEEQIDFSQVAGKENSRLLTKNRSLQQTIARLTGHSFYHEDSTNSPNGEYSNLLFGDQDESLTQIAEAMAAKDLQIIELEKKLKETLESNQNADLLQQIDALNTEKDTETKRVSVLENRLSKADELLGSEGITETIALQEEKISSLSLQLSILQDIKDELEVTNLVQRNQLVTTTNENTALKTTIAEKNVKMNKMDEDLTFQAIQQLHAASELNASEEKIKKLESEKIQRASEFDLMSQNNKQLTEDLSKLQTESSNKMKSKEKEVSDLKTEFQTKSHSLALKEMKKQLLEKNITEGNQALIITQQEKLNDALLKVTTLESSIANKDLELAQKELLLKNKEHENTQIQQERDLAVSSIDLREKENASLTDKLTDMTFDRDQQALQKNAEIKLRQAKETEVDQAIFEKNNALQDLQVQTQQYSDAVLASQQRFDQELLKLEEQREIENFYSQTLAKDLAQLETSHAAEKNNSDSLSHFMHSSAPDYKTASLLLFGDPEQKSEKDKNITFDFYRKHRRNTYKNVKGQEHTQIDLSDASDEQIMEEVKKDNQRAVTNNLKKLINTLCEYANEEPLIEAIPAAFIITAISFTDKDGKFAQWKKDNPNKKLWGSFAGKLEQGSIEEEIRSNAIASLVQSIETFAPLFEGDNEDKKMITFRKNIDVTQFTKNTELLEGEDSQGLDSPKKTIMNNTQPARIHQLQVNNSKERH